MRITISFIDLEYNNTFHRQFTVRGLIMSFSLSLSGGGCKAAAHAGVLKALDRHNLTPTAVSGTSAGALVAALYCIGRSSEQLEAVCLELEKHGHKLIDWDIVSVICSAVSLAFGKKGTTLAVLKGEAFYSFLKQLFGNAKISSAKIPLFISASDLISGNTVCFSNTPLRHRIANTVFEKDISLCDAVYSSCCLPSVFPPLKNSTGMLVDGGVTDNLPVDFLFAANMPNIVAVDVGSAVADNSIDSLPEVISRSVSIMGERLKNCYVTGERLRISPHLPQDAGVLSFDKIGQCFDAGYASASELIPLIKSL